MNRSLLFAGLIGGLVAAGPALGASDEEIKSYCELRAAAVWPNLLDAFENTMRARTYRDCVLSRTAPRAVPPAKPAEPPLTAEEDARLTQCANDPVCGRYIDGMMAHDYYERALATLTGETRKGADWWERTNAATRQAKGCGTPTTWEQGNWTRGCLWAKASLAPLEQSRQTEPEFNQGWLFWDEVKHIK